MAQRFSVRSAEDLFGLLDHPEASVRLALLKHIVNQPERAAAHGKHGERDLVDELIRLFQESTWADFRLLVLYALLALDDPRAVPVCQEELKHGSDLRLLLAAAKRLDREPIEVRMGLAPLLFETSRDKVRVVANLLRDGNDLPPRERLQVALYATRPALEPPTLESSAPLWFAALQGPREERARDLLEKKGEAVFIYLGTHWRELPGASLAWFFDWAASTFPGQATLLVEEALATGREDAALAALGVVPHLDATDDLAPLVVSFAQHPNPELRLAVLRSGLVSLDLERLAREEALEIRLAAIARLPQAHGAESLPTLLAILEDEDWRVRSAATNALVRIGEPAAEAVKPLVRSERTGTRTAAVQVLTQLDETPWLETLLA